VSECGLDSTGIGEGPVADLWTW